MKILFLGGTKFVGRQMLEDAILAGHEVVVYQRGQTHIEFKPEVKRILADRMDIETALPEDFKCDVVIDTCGYHPLVVRKSVNRLKAIAKKYIFVSTISVYKNPAVVGITEQSEVSSIEVLPDIHAKITNENYGPLKALCESEVQTAFPDKSSLILRPTIIAGIGDTSERFDYWLKEVKNKSEVPVPKNLDVPFQLIDVRALSDLAMKGLGADLHGVFNVTGPRNKSSFKEFLELLKKNLNPEVRFVPSQDSEKSFPLYVEDPEWIGIFQVNGSKAQKAGMLDISLADTIVHRAKSLF